MGFDRVYRSLAAAGKEPPRIEVGPRFTVVVPGGQGDRAFARFLRSEEFSEPRLELASDLDVLLTLSILRTRASVTAVAVAPEIQREPDFADEVLRRMHTDGLIDPTRSTAGRRRSSYRLSAKTAAALRPALKYRAGTIDIDDAKLLRHLKRHRRIANEDVRNYLECDVSTARNRLSRLRKRGYITIDPTDPSVVLSSSTSRRRRSMSLSPERRTGTRPRGAVRQRETHSPIIWSPVSRFGVRCRSNAAATP